MPRKVIRIKSELSKPCPAVRLRNGKSIPDPLGYALAFVQSDGSYQKYDKAFVPQDSVLSRNDIILSRKIGSRLSDRSVEDVLSDSLTINTLLSDIPASANLSESDVPWDVLKRIYSILVQISGVRISIATKILHKKRPALVPVLDNEVAKYLRSVESLTSDRVEEGIALTQSFKRELEVNIEALTCVRTALKKRGLELTEVRLLDIYIWAYSGTYDPPFLRR
jgi:hypothetical protein